MRVAINRTNFFRKLYKEVQQSHLIYWSLCSVALHIQQIW